MLINSVRTLAARNASQTTRLFSSYAMRLAQAGSVNITIPNGLKYEQPTGLFINNEFVTSSGEEKLTVLNPSTEDVITEVYSASDADVEKAVVAAEEAFKTWQYTSPTERGELLRKVAEKIEAEIDLIASIESLDNGKTFSMAKGDIKLVINVLKNYAGWADKLFGHVVESGTSHFNYTRREPLGVCGQIIAWNFPLLLWSWKIGPALATGNTVVLKPAESTPLSALYVSKFFKEVGFPPGVYNLVCGAGNVGATISSHPRIKKVAFTGSTATGRHIMKAAATSNLKKVTLELGGKSPNIVFNDADLESTIKNVWTGIFFNSGEVCSAGSRIYVQEGIYEEFLAKFKEYSEARKPGDPFDPKTGYGPQTNQQQIDKILSYIKIGKEQGARVVTGGERVPGKGYFIKPTIFADVQEDFKIVKEEIFGPVVTISKFTDVADVMAKAHDTEYGLAAGIHTQDVNKALTLANRLKAGTVWINTYNDFHHQVPFGGFNQSGIGREMGVEALDAYTQVKAVRIGGVEKV